MADRWWLGLAVLVACGGGASATPVETPHPVASATPSTPPASEPKRPGVLQLALGDFHSCALLADHTVACWGRNRGGELGDGTTEDRHTPTAVKGLSGVEQIALGSNFSCARTSDKKVLCWGTGRLFSPQSIATKTTPELVPNVVDVVEIAAGGYMACARASSGAVTCWGLEKKAAGEPKTAATIVAAAAHGCAKLTTGAVRCFGDGPWSDGKGAFSNPGLSSVDAVSTGDGFACAVSGGTVACWGRNDSGELGTEADFDDHKKPVTVPNVRAVQRISSAESHTCVVLQSGTVECWGDNSESELGRGTQTTGEAPASVPGLAGVVEVVVGTDHVCARTAADVFCWGNNRAGQLGDGSTERRSSPTKVHF